MTTADAKRVRHLEMELRTVRDKLAEVFAALDAWKHCRSHRLSWRSGPHCRHCDPLRKVLQMR